MSLKLLLVLLGLCITSYSYQVLELGDNFPEIRKKGGFWLVMFYAPWCGHCRRFEPLWNEIGKALEKTNIGVAKIDCSRFPSMASEFGIRGYPTVKFITADSSVTFNGLRHKEEIINFAVRLTGPTIQEILDPEILPNFLNMNKLFFMYVGENKGPLWNSYSEVAKKMQPHGYFYSANENIAKQHLKLKSVPSILVYKDNKAHFFSGIDKKSHLNASLLNWVSEERYPTFTEISFENINELVQLKKNIVLTIIDEKQLHIGSEMEVFKNMMEDFAKEYRGKYHKHYQFGWTGSRLLGNSITVQILSLPCIIVLNLTTDEYYVPEEDIAVIDFVIIDGFLEKVLNQSVPAYGGKDFVRRVRRGLFDSYVTFMGIWNKDPMMAVLLFGISVMVLSFIVYTICCDDISQEEGDEEDDEDLHDKKD